MTRLDKCEALWASTFAETEATVAKIKATLAEVEASILEALRARPGIALSVHIPLSTMIWMSSPAAAGLSNNVATATLQIKEVCSRQDAHLEAFMADFLSFADNLDHRQPSMPASIALIDDDDDDDKDEAIYIALSIDNANVKFKDIAVVLAPPPPLPYEGAVVPILGGKHSMLTPNMLSAFEPATVPPKKTTCQHKQPCCRPCHRNQPWVPNQSDKEIPSHPHPVMGVTSKPTTTLPAMPARATNHRSIGHCQCPTQPDLEIGHPRFRALGRALHRAGLGRHFSAALAP